jgi:hypothetical protein
MEAINFPNQFADEQMLTTEAVADNPDEPHLLRAQETGGPFSRAIGM